LKDSKIYKKVQTLEQLAAFKIVLKGKVQGMLLVPFVQRLAKEEHIDVWSALHRNRLEIALNAPIEQVMPYYRRLLLELPGNAAIDDHSIDEIGYNELLAFQKGSEVYDFAELVAADLAICPSCRLSLYNIESSSYRYPFTSCPKCGPRYSIAKKAPLALSNTTYSPFKPCASCKEALLANPSLLTLCTGCGPHLTLLDRSNEIQANTTDKSLQLAVKALSEGAVVAVKDVGGYVLLVDASSASGIKMLRERKGMLSKPLALIFPNLEMLRLYVDVEEVHEQELMGFAGTSVLAPIKPELDVFYEGGILPKGVSKVAVSIPHSAILELVVGDFAKPVAVASACRVGQGSAYSTDRSLEIIPTLADCCLTHGLDITTPTKASLVTFSPFRHQRIVLKRSRGLAPSFYGYKPNSERTILSTGAQSKSTIGMAHAGQVYVSQSFGNTENTANQQEYLRGVAFFEQLLGVKPSVLLGDLSSTYFTHHAMEAIARREGAHSDTIQHHKAHFAAVLAENGLLDSDEPVLGVIWDSNGLGEDGFFWGGEFFTFCHGEMERTAHISYFPNLLGEKMASEPRVGALALFSEFDAVSDLLEAKFAEREWLYFNKFLHLKQNRYTSSMGVVFDAVASLLDLCNRQSFDRHAQLLLEEVATAYARSNGMPAVSSYFDGAVLSDKLSISFLLDGVVTDLQASIPVDAIAYKFHFSMAGLVARMADYAKVKVVALSGSVFQNGLLVDMVLAMLEPSKKVYLHQQLAPNDECVALGQLVYYDRGIDSLFSNVFTARNGDDVLSNLR
jgi:hydrogenase maturation protein HypF